VQCAIVALRLPCIVQIVHWARWRPSCRQQHCGSGRHLSQHWRGRAFSRQARQLKRLRKPVQARVQEQCSSLPQLVRAYLPCPPHNPLFVPTGGGLGYLSSQYGMACDQVVALRMVDAQGNLVTSNAKTNPALRAAECGCGGGNFGWCRRGLVLLATAAGVHLGTSWAMPGVPASLPCLSVRASGA
jgi:hypothetical protein